MRREYEVSGLLRDVKKRASKNNQDTQVIVDGHIVLGFKVYDY